MAKEQQKVKIEINGHELEVKPIGWDVVLVFAERLGWLDYINDRERLSAEMEQLGETQRIDKIKAMNGLLNYCSGWGVTNDPTDDDEELLMFLNLNSKHSHIKRANWVRVILFEGDIKKSFSLFEKISAISKPEEDTQES